MKKFLGKDKAEDDNLTEVTYLVTDREVSGRPYKDPTLLLKF